MYNERISTSVIEFLNVPNDFRVLLNRRNKRVRFSERTSAADHVQSRSFESDFVIFNEHSEHGVRSDRRGTCRLRSKIDRFQKARTTHTRRVILKNGMVTFLNSRRLCVCAYAIRITRVGKPYLLLLCTSLSN